MTAIHLPVSYTHLDVYKRQEQGKQSDYYLKLDTDKAITYGLICDGGLLEKDDNLLKVDEDGYCQIDEHMFDKDALIIENRQASKVSLCTPCLLYTSRCV